MNHSSMNEEATRSRRSTACRVFSLIVALAATVSPSFADGIPLKPGLEGDVTSSDISDHVVKGKGTLKLKLYNPSDGSIAVDIDYTGADVNSYFHLTDTKAKGGHLKVTVVKGDPLAELEGPLTSGSGTFHVSTSGFGDGLFPESDVNITLLTGFMQIGMTTPGDQLTGPDGNDTYIRYTTTWQSFDPIGKQMFNGTEYDIVLGEFTLNSVGRPTVFNYSFTDANPLTAMGSFTIEEDVGLGDTTIMGTVTKSFRVTAVPEPAAFGLVGAALIALVSLGSRYASSRLRFSFRP